MGEEGYGRMAEDTSFSFEQGPIFKEHWTLPGRLWVRSNKSHERRILFIMIKILDYIILKCEEFREYLIMRSLPKDCYDQKAKAESLKKWVNQSENSYK